MMLAFHSDLSPVGKSCFSRYVWIVWLLSKSFTIFVKKIYYIYGKALAHLSKI